MEDANHISLVNFNCYG